MPSLSTPRLAAVVPTTILAIALAFSPARQLVAQAPATASNTLEFRITGGGLVATGSQRDFIKDAQVTAAQLVWVVRPSVAVAGTFGWARSRDLGSVNAPKLDVFTSDVGVEVRPTTWKLHRSTTFAPFAGLGGGLRSYNHRKLRVDATHNLAGYASVGGELGVGRVGLRLEMRDYVTGFKPLVGEGTSRTRNDILLMVGLRFNRYSR